MNPAIRLMAHSVPWLLALALYFLGEQYLSLGTQVLVWILFALSLDLVLGYAGIVTMGHAAFFGIGAYAAGLFAIHISPDPLLGHAAAIACGAALALLTGAITLHSSGIAFLILSMAVVSGLYEVANQTRSISGGDDGLQGIKLSPLLGRFEFNLFGHTAYLYALVVLFVWFLLAWRLVHSPFGRSLVGIRQNPRRMHAIGTPVWWRLLMIYTIAGAMAGSAGALSAHATRYVGLSVLSLTTSGVVMVMLILGGTGRLYGAFVGAAVYMLVQDATAKVNPYLWEFVVGVLLIATVLFLEGGLMGLQRHLRRPRSGNSLRQGMHPDATPVEPGPTDPEVTTGAAR